MANHEPVTERDLKGMAKRAKLAGQVDLESILDGLAIMVDNDAYMKLAFMRIYELNALILANIQANRHG